MSIEIKQLPNEPIIVLKVVPPPVVPDDTITVTKEAASFKKKVGGHIYRIVDFSAFSKNFSFADLIHGMAAELKVEGGINDMDVSSIFVGSDEWVVFGAKAFQEQDQYGPTNVKHICTTVEEAVEFARNDMKSK